MSYAVHTKEHSGLAILVFLALLALLVVVFYFFSLFSYGQASSSFSYNELWIFMDVL